MALLTHAIKIVHIDCTLFLKHKKLCYLIIQDKTYRSGIYAIPKKGNFMLHIFRDLRREEILETIAWRDQRIVEIPPTKLQTFTASTFSKILQSLSSSIFLIPMSKAKYSTITADST